MSFADAGYRFRYMEWAKTVMEAPGRAFIDIGSSGIAALTLRELGVKSGDLELSGPHFYGEPTMRRLVAVREGVGGERVLPTLGASHAHFLVCASLIAAGDEVIVETPGYEALTAVPRAFGASIVPLARRFENGYQFDPDELRRLLTPRTRLVIVTNLHNPSGAALSAECLAALAAVAGASLSRGSPASRKISDPLGGPSWIRDSGLSIDVPRGPWVLVNEVYRDFVSRGVGPPGHRLGPRGISISSLTKVYGLGETRAGWMIGDPALMHRASRVNDFGVVNGPYIAERIGAIALARRRKLLARARAILRRNRPLLERFLEATPQLELVRPAAGTVLFPRLRGASDTRVLADRALREKGVCIVPGAFFGAPSHIRLGIGQKDPRVLNEGLRRLRAAIGESGGPA